MNANTSIHQNNQPLTHYEPNYFVNRERELKIVEDRMVKIASRESISDPIINFWGVGGIGKSWLLQRLSQLYAFEPVSSPSKASLTLPSFSLLYSFPEDASPQALTEMVNELAHMVEQQLATQLTVGQQEQLERARAEVSISHLVTTLRSLLESFVLLLLFDNTEYVLSSEWEVLEAELLDPLVRTGRCVIAVAGRQQRLFWRQYEVRRRVMERLPSEVRPFSLKAVRQMLQQRRSPHRAESVFRFTAGNPRFVVRLIQLSPSFPQTTPPDEFLAELQKTEKDMLRSITHHANSHELTKALAVLTPLRFYRQEALSILLQMEQGERKQPPGYYLRLLRTLASETDVVLWDGRRRVYCTSEVMRGVMNQRLAIQEPELYRRRHQNAILVCETMIQKFPGMSEAYLVEKWFHHAHLAQGDNSYPAQPPLPEELKSVRTIIFTDLDKAGTDLSPARLKNLKRAVDKDKELKLVLSAPLYKDLKDRLQTMISGQ